MLKTGLYKAEITDNIWSAYSITMRVKETEKSYIFDLVDLQSRYSASHFRMMFQNSKHYVLRKNESRDTHKHAMKKWSESDFTIYPYQAGIPYYFTLVDEEVNDT